VVADHARVWARGATVTDEAHRQAAHVLREPFREPSCNTDTDTDDLVRDLTDYDRAFGLTDGEVA
jgi:hypothetical protein